MILGKVRIQNFKSIKDTGWVYLSKNDLITVLAGQNESGKTSFLSALRFFEEGAYESFEDYDRQLGMSPRVDCTFYITDDEYAALLEETNKEIANYIKKNGFNFLRGDIEKDEFGIRYTEPAELKKLVENFNATPEKKLPAEGEAAPEEKKNFDLFAYLKEIRPQMVFYASFLENTLPGKALKGDIDNNQAILDFEKIYNVDFKQLMDTSTSDVKRRTEEERIRKSAAQSLNKYWNQEISGEKADYSYAITINSQVSNPEQSSVNFYVNQGDSTQLNFSQKSQGFRWFAGFNLRLRAHETELEEKGLILLIDEPGQGLHEVAQQDVKNVIEELAAESGIQIIYSTHQPILLGKENIDFSRLLLVDRTIKKGSTFKTVSALVGSKGSKDALAPIRSALGMVTLTDPLTNKKTLIVEGITEFFIIKAIFGDEYAIVPSTGVDQVPNIFSILYGWGVPVKALFDDDRQGTSAFNKLKKSLFNDEETDSFNKIALKPAGRDGIETYLSQEVIEEILHDFGMNYQPAKSKVENVEQIGKYIFAKTFYDKYFNNPEDIDLETMTNFSAVSDFLNASF